MWDKSQPGNSQPSSLIGTCLTLPNLGFLWVFFKFPKISKNGNRLFFPVSGSISTSGSSSNIPDQLEFENAGFEERARTEYPKKNLFKARQRPTTWGPLVIQLKYCPMLPSLNKVDKNYYYIITTMSNHMWCCPWGSSTSHIGERYSPMNHFWTSNCWGPKSGLCQFSPNA